MRSIHGNLLYLLKVVDLSYIFLFVHLNEGEPRRTRTISFIYKSQSYLKKLTIYNNINYILGNSFLFIGCIILLNNSDYFLNETKSLFMLVANTLKWLSLTFNILIY